MFNPVIPAKAHWCPGFRDTFDMCSHISLDHRVGDGVLDSRFRGNDKKNIDLFVIPAKAGIQSDVQAWLDSQQKWLERIVPETCLDFDRPAPIPAIAVLPTRPAEKSRTAVREGGNL